MKQKPNRFLNVVLNTQRQHHRIVHRLWHETLEARHLLSGSTTSLVPLDPTNPLTAPAEIRLADAAGQAITIYGANTQDRSGRSVSDVGDVNGDGFDDLIIGAELADGATDNSNEAGTSYLLFGSADFADRPSIDLATLGEHGVAIHGIDAEDNSGKVVSGAGDVNGDGLDDLLIGAGSADGQDNTQRSTGETYLIFGRADLASEQSIELNSLGSSGVIIYGGARFDKSGWISVASAGDVNGDGLDDVIIGAPYGDSADDSTINTGSANLIFGRKSWPDSLSLDDTDGIVLFDGISMLDKTGWAVSAAGDINGDGIDDVAIGAPNAAPTDSPIRGMAYVVFGKTDWSQSQVVRLGELGQDGITILGRDTYDDHGAAISRAGDINGDGLDDLLIGAYSADSIENSRQIAGESYLLLGRTSWPESGIVDLQIPTPLITTIFGDQEKTRSGKSLRGSGDVNGDGFDDLIIGSQNSTSDANSPPKTGQTFVLFGGSDWTADSIDLANIDSSALVLSGVDTGDSSGRYVSGAGDINGDGLNEVIIGAFFADGPDNSRRDAGESYLVWGDDFLKTITMRGTNNSDHLVGEPQSDLIVAGQADDSIHGKGGLDSIYAGEGNDSISVGDLNFRRISGGNGIDTLRFSFATADLTTLPNSRISGIERIDLLGTVATTLTLNHRTVLQLSDESNQVIIDARPNDNVNLGTGWTILPAADENYVTYFQGHARALLTPPIGDSTRDGVFNSSDLIQVLQIAEYEDDIPGNSTFADGDWNGDGDFNSTDLLLAFQEGNYTRHATPIHAVKTSAPRPVHFHQATPVEPAQTTQATVFTGQVIDRLFIEVGEQSIDHSLFRDQVDDNLDEEKKRVRFKHARDFLFPL